MDAQPTKKRGTPAGAKRGPYKKREPRVFAERGMQTDAAEVDEGTQTDERAAVFNAATQTDGVSVDEKVAFGKSWLANAVSAFNAASPSHIEYAVTKCGRYIERVNKRAESSFSAVQSPPVVFRRRVYTK
jgi:hypothetical protein